MNNATAALAAKMAMRLGRAIEEIREEFLDDPAYGLCGADPVLVGLVLTLCNSVMVEENWASRRRLFEAFVGMDWPEGVEVRERLDELLNGINLRADYWHSN